MGRIESSRLMAGEPLPVPPLALQQLPQGLPVRARRLELRLEPVPAQTQLPARPAQVPAEQIRGWILLLRSPRPAAERAVPLLPPGMPMTQNRARLKPPWRPGLQLKTGPSPRCESHQSL